MSRALRIKFEGAWYHVMNRGINHQKIFFNNNHRAKFLEYLGKIVKIYGIEVHSYCLMDNHYHLILHTPRGNISEAMKYLNGSYAQYLNITLERDGAAFRGRFHAIVISEDNYLINLSRYIHRNPLSAGITRCLEDYKWSSYPTYLKKISTPDWLTVMEIIGQFGVIEFTKKYKAYVECETDDELSQILGNKKSLPVLGNDDFRKRVDEYVKKQRLSVEIVGSNRILARPKIEELVKSVADYFDKDFESIRMPTHRSKNTARTLAIYICREVGGYSLAEIGKFMGGVTYKAISSVIYRVKQDKAKSRVIKRLVVELSFSKKIPNVRKLAV